MTIYGSDARYLTMDEFRELLLGGLHNIEREKEILEEFEKKYEGRFSDAAKIGNSMTNEVIVMAEQIYKKYIELIKDK